MKLKYEKESIVMKVLGSFVVAWSFLTFVVPPAQAQENMASNDATLSVARSVAPAQPDPADYKIGPQDVLRIDVWKEEQLSRMVPVRPDGKISLPLLDDVQANGLTSVQLAGVIRDGLRKYMNNPKVTVTIAEINSRRVYVTGEVSRPGNFPLLPNMTVLQALSNGGSFTQFARSKKIYVLRTENGKETKFPFNYREAISGKHPEQNIILKSGDVIVVP
jgi:polysaccharide biosynthesis/export protein